MNITMNWRIFFWIQVKNIIPPSPLLHHLCLIFWSHFIVTSPSFYILEISKTFFIYISSGRNKNVMHKIIIRKCEVFGIALHRAKHTSKCTRFKISRSGLTKFWKCYFMLFAHTASSIEGYIYEIGCISMCPPFLFIVRIFIWIKIKMAMSILSLKKNLE
jgi:hypothetical protein